MDRAILITLALYGFSALALFVGRNSIKASIERGVQHIFDAKLEALRTELRKSEETFKGDLRTKESEIAALRDGVLSGRAQRQALLDKRRLDAVERIWASVIALSPFKAVSASMAVIKFDVVAERAPRDAKVRKFFEILIEVNQPDPKGPHNAAYLERPFVSPLAWAYYSAYSTVVSSAYARAKLLEMGAEDARNLLNTDFVRSLLKAALPEYSNYIDEVDPSAYHYLLDELEKRLLAELKEMLEGTSVDEASVTQAAKIMDQVNKVQTETLQAASRAEPTNAGTQG